MMEIKEYFMDENWQEVSPEKAKYKFTRWIRNGELILEAFIVLR